MGPNRKQKASAHHSPFVADERRKRREDGENRLADWITDFVGSMRFVYLMAAVFFVWMVFLEENPWPTLTLAVSLEAIFLTSFVMIGQNRQSDFQQAKADHDFEVQERELAAIHALTQHVYDLLREPRSSDISERVDAR